MVTLQDLKWIVKQPDKEEKAPTLKLETKIIKSKGPAGVGQATAYVDGKVVVSAELTFMVGE